jgi:AcrR family transcriptional regulator
MRERILAAAIEVIKQRGVTGATTKEIARAAGVSEGSLYNHFDNKTALFGSALAEVAGSMRAAIAELGASAGRGTVEGNLANLAGIAVRFYGELLPMTGPVLGEPEIIAWLRTGGPAAGGSPLPAAGPVLGVAGLAAYLEAERAGGRLAADVRPYALAAALLGACLQQAFLVRLSGAETVESIVRLPADPDAFGREIVATLLAGRTI